MVQVEEVSHLWLATGTRLASFGACRVSDSLAPDNGNLLERAGRKVTGPNNVYLYTLTGSPDRLAAPILGTHSR